MCQGELFGVRPRKQHTADASFHGLNHELYNKRYRRGVCETRLLMAIGDLTSSYEDYIEAIYDLANRGGGSVRSVDVASELGFSKASVARATKNLREMGYINQERYGEITLTTAGEEYGKHVLMRHKVLRAFLIEVLGVEEETANAEACEMEHTVSQDTMDKWISWYETHYGPLAGEGMNIHRS